MNNFVCITPAAEVPKLDKLVAKCFYGNNLSFNTADSKTFKDLVTQLRPSYDPPNRKRLSNDLLDEVYEDTQEELKAQIKDKETITISQDGWSNTSFDPILAVSICDGKKSYLIDLEDTGSAVKSAEYCYEKVLESIVHVKEKYGKECFAIVTDNENKMLALRRLIIADHPDMISYGCGAHYINLVMGKIVNKDILEQVVHVNKYFRNHHSAHGMLKEKGGVQPQLVGDTRWNSAVDTCESYERNIDIYRQIRVETYDTDVIDDITAEKIANIGLSIMVTSQLEILRKYGNALDKMQSDTCR